MVWLASQFIGILRVQFPGDLALSVRALEFVSEEPGLFKVASLVSLSFDYTTWNQ